jgi:hypothetical protein
VRLTVDPNNASPSAKRLASPQTDAHLNAYGPSTAEVVDLESSLDRHRTGYGLRHRRKGRQEAIARMVDLAPLVSQQGLANDLVVLPQHRESAGIPERIRDLSRVRHVGKHDGPEARFANRFTRDAFGIGNSPEEAADR